MKLLFCTNCGDIFNLKMMDSKSCNCGMVKGMYIDNLNAIFEGKCAIPLCISNPSIKRGIIYQKQNDIKYPEAFNGEKFDSWVCPANSNTFKRSDII